MQRAFCTNLPRAATSSFDAVVSLVASILLPRLDAQRHVYANCGSSVSARRISAFEGDPIVAFGDDKNFFSPELVNWPDQYPILNIAFWRGTEFALVDNSCVLFVSPDAERDVVMSDEVDDVAVRRAEFDRLWATCFRAEKLYYDRSRTTRDSDHAVSVESKRAWQRYVEMISKRPELMRHMQPRVFEELVAELLRSQGLQVMLTPRSRDGGRDILARLATPLGEHVYLVECKRFDARKPVGVSLVRQLYGVVELEGATAGVLVTTSSFTAGARQTSASLGSRMSLRDYNDLRLWLHNATSNDTA